MSRGCAPTLALNPKPECCVTQLKSRYGLGYTLTLVNAGASSSSAASFAETLLELVRRHVPAAAALSAVGAELSIQVRGATCHTSPVACMCELSMVKIRSVLLWVSARYLATYQWGVGQLPREAAAAFPAMLRELEASEATLGVGSYGISITSMEEVFLALAHQQTEQIHTHASDAAAVTAEAEDARESVSTGCAAIGKGETSDDAGRGESGETYAMREGDGDGDSGGEESESTGVTRFMEQVHALVVKRALNSYRDKLAVLTQLVAPVAFVLMALSVSEATSAPANVQSRRLDQHWAMNDFAVAWGGVPPAGADLSARTGYWKDSRATSEWVADLDLERALPLPSMMSKSMGSPVGCLSLCPSVVRCLGFAVREAVPVSCILHGARRGLHTKPDGLSQLE